MDISRQGRPSAIGYQGYEQRARANRPKRSDIASANSKMQKYYDNYIKGDGKRVNSGNKRNDGHGYGRDGRHIQNFGHRDNRGVVSNNKDRNRNLNMDRNVNKNRDKRITNHNMTPGNPKHHPKSNHKHQKHHNPSPQQP